MADSYGFYVSKYSIHGCYGAYKKYKDIHFGIYGGYITFCWMPVIILIIGLCEKDETTWNSSISEKNTVRQWNVVTLHSKMNKSVLGGSSQLVGG